MGAAQQLGKRPDPQLIFPTKSLTLTTTLGRQVADGETEAGGGGGGAQLAQCHITSRWRRWLQLVSVSASPGLIRLSPDTGGTHRKGLWGQNHTRGSEKEQPGLGVKTSSQELAALTHSLTLANQSHSSSLPQFLHFTAGCKISPSLRGVRITEEVCFE